MEDNLLCTTCNKEFSSKIEGRTCGQYCVSCNAWGAVTSYFTEIELDHTYYTINIIFTSFSHLKLNQLKYLSKIAEMNFLQLKKHIDSRTCITVTGQAQNILDIQENIKTYSHLIYTINPDFPY